MKVLVTGAAGFIGSHLCEALLELGIQVTGLDNFDPNYSREIKEENLRGFISNPSFEFVEGDVFELSNLIPNGTRFNAIFHMASKVSVLPSIKNPSAYIRSNILGTQAVLDFKLANSIEHLIFASSSSVYGNNGNSPSIENKTPIKPISPYAITKRTSELLIQAHQNLYNTKAICLRLFTVFGERQRPDLAINKFLRLALNNEPITMYGDGSSARDYTYVGDVIQGFLKAFDYLKDKNATFEVFNIGSNNPIKLSKLINQIYLETGLEPNIKTLPFQKGDVEMTYADIEKAKKILGYQPQVKFKAGLNKFIKWEKDNLSKLIERH